jgi:hypothetical protein
MLSEPSLHITFVDGILAVAVLGGLVLNAALGWWADPDAVVSVVMHAVIST